MLENMTLAKPFFLEEKKAWHDNLVFSRKTGDDGSALALKYFTSDKNISFGNMKCIITILPAVRRIRSIVVFQLQYKI